MNVEKRMKKLVQSIETDIFNYRSKELFINLKPSDIPPKGHRDREAFISYEEDKCLQGVTINGIPIPPTFYWDINHWKILKDIKDSRGIIRKVPSLPDIRDNDWKIHNGMYQAELARSNFVEGTARQLGKSKNKASIMGRDLMLIDNCNDLLLCGNSGDLKIMLEYLFFGTENCTDFFRVPRLTNDMKSLLFKWGFKTPQGEEIVKSGLHVRNAQNGKVTEVSAGVTIYRGILDEALKNDSIVYYENRVGTIGEVKIGDEIYGQDGKLTTVLDVIPHKNEQLYKVTLRDGRSVEATGNHLWEVYDNGRKKYVILTTEQIYKTNNLSQIDKRYDKIVKKQRYFLRKNSVIDYPERSIDIDPYYLGMWLGDGNSGGYSIITTIDDEIITYIENYSRKLQLKFKNSPDKQQVHLHNEPSNRKWTDLTRAYTKYNLIDNKHIPEDFLYNSYENRLELLKGLMDTDGTCYKTGTIEFTNTNEQLIKDFEFLVRSLGISCSTRKKKAGYKDKNNNYIRCKDAYTVRLSTDMSVFKLTRKLLNYKESTNLKGKSFQEKISIVSIEPTEIGDATCIKVDNENSLFLTNDFIVTHNCGKYNFRSSYETIKPALVSEFGVRSASILSFTGGDVLKSKDAQEIFLNPQAANFASFDNEEKKTGFFLSGIYRQDLKKQIKFGEYLGLKDKSSELYNLPIRIADEEKANEVLDAEEALAAKSIDPTAYIKQKMYNPRKIADMFLTPDVNPFNIAELQRQKEYLLANPIGTAYTLEKINGIVVPKLSNKQAIHEYPLQNMLVDKDAPIIFYDLPKYTDHYDLQILGCDPYNEDEGTSLGSVYGFRREHTDLTDNFQKTMIFSYTARPPKLRAFVNNLVMLQELCNGQILHEVSGNPVLSIFEGLHKSQHLMDTYNIQREINPRSNTTTNKGMRANVVNNLFRLNVTKDYLEEDLGNGRLGYSRILDPVLCDELIQWDGEKNADRYDAFSYGIVHMYAKQKYNTRPFITSVEKEIEKPVEKKKIHSVFRPMTRGKSLIRR